MFIRLYKAKLKILLRRKSTIFWTLIYPFILGFFFQMALGNVGEDAKLKTIDIAVINNTEYKENINFKSVIESLSKDDDNQLFNTIYVDKDEAEDKLKSNDIEAYIEIVDNKPKLIAKENGLNETIIKYVLDEYYQISNAGAALIEYNPETLYNGALELLTSETSYTEDKTTEKINFSLNYFLTLIAMACMYGGLLGLESIKDNEANLTAKGARICIAPVNKMLVLLSGILAGFTLQIITMFFLFLYLIYVFNVDFGPHIPQIAFLSGLGCLAGTAFGTFVASSNKKNEGFKMGILIAITMMLCFFAGMMASPSLRATMDASMPLFRKINPVHIITDGFYALYAYDNFTVYYDCIFRLSIFTIIMIILTFIFVRRKNYDSI